MDAAERAAFIDAWIAYEHMFVSRERFVRLQAEELHGWASDRMRSLTLGDPELVWTLILEILARDPDDHIRTMVAAGPFQQLVSDHCETFADRIEEQARRNFKFREMLSGLISMPDEFYERIQHLIPK
jgi:Family of unknown function (DUF6869)